MRGRPALGVSLAMIVASQALAACGGADTSRHATGAPSVPASKPVAITRANAQQRCASASVFETSLRVEHVVVARLDSVRRWVTQVEEIDWRTFSTDLATGAPSERLAVCVVSPADGTLLSFPGDSHKARSAAIIVSPTGTTMYEEGGTEDMIDSLADLQSRSLH